MASLLTAGAKGFWNLKSQTPILSSTRSAGAVFVAAYDLGHFEERPIRFGCVLQDFVQRKPRLDDIVPQDIAQRDRMSHGLDAADVDLADFGDVFEDRLKLSGKCLEVAFIQIKPGQLGDMPDVTDRDFGALSHRGGCTGMDGEVASRPAVKVVRSKQANRVRIGEAALEGAYGHNLRFYRTMGIIGPCRATCKSLTLIWSTDRTPTRVNPNGKARCGRSHTRIPATWI